MIRSPKPSSDPAGDVEGAEDRRSGHELRRRLGQQAAVAEIGRLAMTGTPPVDLARRAVAVVAEQLGIPLVAALAPHVSGGLIVLARVDRPEEVDPTQVVEPGEGDQSRLAMETRDVVVSRDFATEERFTPNPELVEAGARSSAAVPVGVTGQPYGVLVAASRRVDDFAGEDVYFLESIANTLGAAIERERAQRAIEAEQTSLREALEHSSQQERRFRELANSAPAFVWTADADGMVDFINRGWLEYTGNTLEDELGDSWSLGVHPDDGQAVATSWWQAHRAREPWEREYRLRRYDGAYRWIADRGVPVFDDGELTGYVGTATDIHERKEMEQRISHAYERDHEVAETLQRSMLPERMPEIDGVALEARYLPAREGAMVGGDWYDALELDDGRVALVVGDVVGHGLRAASIMGQLRNAFRAYAVLGDSPSTTLARLNRLLMKDGRDLMATALYLLLDRDTGTVSYASAGHPPALAVTVGGEAHFLEGGRSVPLGTTDADGFQTAESALADHTTLLLYTDGLIERRDSPLAERLDDLAAIATHASGSLAEVCDEVVAGALGAERPTDDVALIAVRPDPVTAGELDLRLPADPASLMQLRRRLGRFAQGAGATAAEEFDIVLAVSEAAMNAIEHAYGPGDAEFRVEARVEDRELVATVLDAGSWRERRGDDHGRGLSIMEALMDEIRVERGDQGTRVWLRRRVGETAVEPA